jgi:uncharacterized protein
MRRGFKVLIRKDKPGCLMRLVLATAAMFAVAAHAQERPQVSSPGETGQTIAAAAAGQNHLKHQKSPYLLEHAHDPVNWFAWGPEAFQRARRQNKLIFLSVGYSACHWCHVMQKEDFEDPHVAALLNNSFVSILVDREERPDIDSQYMAVSEMLTGTGGWPLVIVMTPDRQPFFASTYLPRQSAGGRAGMLEVLPRLEQNWKSHPDKLMKIGEKLSRLLAQALVRDAPGSVNAEAAMKSAYGQLASAFDGSHGGFGPAPKFLPDLDLLFLLRYWKRTGDARALEMVEKTLDAMRQGGIFDQVGFGFYRYSTDAEWRVPHFEKMLYDQALMALAYVETYQATRKERFRRTAQEIFAYVRNDLTSPEGAFYDSQDADSADGEGKFYAWTEARIRQALSPAEAAVVLKAFDVTAKGNFPAAGQGENLLYFRASPGRIATELKLAPQQFGEHLESARKALFAVRQKRPRPRIDTKILASWNGLMIAALARAAQAFGDAEYAREAGRAADFILKNLRANDGRLLHSYSGGVAAVPANLDDYAFLICGLTELYEADFQPRYLQAALDLDSQMLHHFWDDRNGGFFFTAGDDSSHLVRQKNMDDADLPSGNSVAALDLLRLASMTGSTTLGKKGTATVNAFAGLVRKSPADYAAALAALDFSLGPSYEVVIAGDSRAAATRAMLHAVSAPFLPDKVVLLRPTEDVSPAIAQLASYTKYQLALGGKPTAYVCRNYECKLPTTDPARMLQLLGAGQN